MPAGAILVAITQVEYCRSLSASRTGILKRPHDNLMYQVTLHSISGHKPVERGSIHSLYFVSLQPETADKRYCLHHAVS